MYKEIKRRDMNSVSNELIELTKKIAYQFCVKNAGRIDYDSIYSAGLEGLAMALKQYDPEKSSQSLSKYSGWCIRNYILQYITNDSRPVKYTPYAYKKSKESGEVVSSVRFDTIFGDEEKSSNIESRIGLAEEENFSNCTDQLSYLRLRLEHSGLSKPSIQAFYAIYGLDGNEEIKLTVYAKQVNLTPGRVSQMVGKVIKWIKGDQNLLEVLATL